MDDMQLCSYDGKEYPASQFDEHGVHKGHKPRHYVTGELVEIGGGTPPLILTQVDRASRGPLADSPADPR